MGYKFNPFTGTLDVVNPSLTNPLLYKGAIAVNTDFPLIAEVQIGWFYTVTANVTDDAGSTYTNTGQSFVLGDEIVWGGVSWVIVGNTSTNYWSESSTPDIIYPTRLTDKLLIGSDTDDNSGLISQVLGGSSIKASDYVEVLAPANASLTETVGGNLFYPANFAFRIYSYKDIGAIRLFSSDYKSVSASAVGPYGIITSVNATPVDGGTDHYVGEILWFFDNGNGDAYVTIDSIDDLGEGFGPATSVSLGSGGTGGVFSGYLNVTGDIGSAVISAIASPLYDMQFAWDAEAGADGYRIQVITDDYNGYDNTYYYDTTNTTEIYSAIMGSLSAPFTNIPNGKYSTSSALRVIGSEYMSGNLDIFGNITNNGSITSLGNIKGLGFQTSNSNPLGLGTQIGNMTYAHADTDITMGQYSEAKNSSAAIGGYGGFAFGPQSLSLMGAQVYDNATNGIGIGFISRVYPAYGLALGTVAKSLNGVMAIGLETQANATKSMHIGNGLIFPETPIYNHIPNSFLLSTFDPKIWLTDNANFFMGPTTIAFDPTSLGSESVSMTDTNWSSSGAWGSYGIYAVDGWSYFSSSGTILIFEFRNQGGTANGRTLYQPNANMTIPIVAGKVYKLSLKANVYDHYIGTTKLYVDVGGVTNTMEISGFDDIGTIKTVYFKAVNNNDLTFYASTPTKYIQLSNISIKEVTAGDFEAIGEVKGSTGHFGDATNYSEFQSDGTMILHGTARVSDQLRIPIDGTRKGSSTPTDNLRAMGASGGVLKPVTSFSKTTQEDVYFEFHAPDQIDDSENVEFHIMWLPGAAWTTGNYMWKLEYLVKSESDPYNTGTPTTISADVTPANAIDMIETHFTSTIDLNHDQILIGHFYRDVANDNADDVGDVNMLEIHFIKNKQGQ